MLSPKRVFAFRHVPFEHLGRIRAPLEARGIGIDYADLYRPARRLPTSPGYDGLIFMGGPMSANDGLPYLARSALIAQAVERRQPVLGVCLGAQLIAKALGANVYRNAVKEIGWFDIRPHRGGRRDPLFAGARSGRNRLPLARRDLRPAAGRGVAGVFRGLPQPGIPRRPRRVRPSVSPGSNARDDRRLVRAGCQLRRCPRVACTHRSAAKCRPAGGPVGHRLRPVVRLVVT